MNNSNKTMTTAKSGGRKLRNDFILLGLLFVSIAVLALSLYLISDEANTVTVTIDGELYGTYSIHDSLTIDIKTGTNEDEVNRLVIEKGKAYISYASCPDGICAEHRPISRTGESIICLPHKVVVSTESNTGNVTPDIVA